MPAPARVLVVDDDANFVLALTALLETEGLEVAGSAANGADAVRLAEELRPSVVTMDIDMPIMDGVEATKRIVPLGIPVVIVSGSRSSERIGQAVAAGAVASIVKTEVTAALAPLLRSLVLRASAR